MMMSAAAASPAVASPAGPPPPPTTTTTSTTSTTVAGSEVDTVKAGSGEGYEGPYEEGFVRDTARFAAKLTPEALKGLQDDGYAIIDDFLGRGWASALRQEIAWLHSKGLMQANRTRFAHPDGRVFAFVKPGISEVDLHDAKIRSLVPELEALFFEDGLVSAFEQALPGTGPVGTREGGMCLRHGPNGKTLKLQRNSGEGGCFPLHYDNPGLPNKRRLSCLLYLNPDWQEGDGGEMCFTPFLGAEVTIPPLMDRLVVFLSDRVLHRVMPALAERYCLTVWLDAGEEEGGGLTVNRPEDLMLKLTKQQLEDWPALCEHLGKSPVQRLLSRGVYSEEYEESLRLCMSGAEGCDEMVHAHLAQVSSMRKNPALWAIIEKLRHTKEEGQQQRRSQAEEGEGRGTGGGH